MTVVIAVVVAFMVIFYLRVLAIFWFFVTLKVFLFLVDELTSILRVLFTHVFINGRSNAQASIVVASLQVFPEAS